MNVQAIPAIDLLDGRCVRLVRGDFEAATVYDDDPLRRAREWRAAGATRVHVVDLDAARGAGTNREIVARIVAEAGVEVQVAGGIRDLAAASAWLNAGAAAVVMGTTAIRDPETLLAVVAAHPGRVLAALDVRAGRAAVDGWAKLASEPLADVLQAWNQLPLAGVVYTAVDRDGTMAGVDVAGLVAVVRASAHPVTYSGGIGGVDDLHAAARAGASGVILGRALYEGRVRLEDAIAG